MHLASGTRHFLRRQSPIAAPSAALAGWIGVVGMEEKERVRARRAAVVALPACSMKLMPPLLSLNAYKCSELIVAYRDCTDVLDGANAVHNGANDAATKSGSNDFFMIMMMLLLTLLL